MIQQDQPYPKALKPRETQCRILQVVSEALLLLLKLLSARATSFARSIAAKTTQSRD